VGDALSVKPAELLKLRIMRSRQGGERLAISRTLVIVSLRRPYFISGYSDGVRESEALVNVTIESGQERKNCISNR